MADTTSLLDKITAKVSALFGSPADEAKTSEASAEQSAEAAATVEHLLAQNKLMLENSANDKAAAFALDAVRKGKITPAQSATLQEAYIDAMEHDGGGQIKSDGAGGIFKGDAVAAIERLMENQQSNKLLEAQVPSDKAVSKKGDTQVLPTDQYKPDQAYFDSAIASTPTGKKIVANRNREQK